MGKSVAGPIRNDVEQDPGAKPRAADTPSYAAPDKRGYTQDPIDQLAKKNADARSAQRSQAAKAFSSGMNDYSRAEYQDAASLLRPSAAPIRASGSGVPPLNLPSFKKGGTMRRKGVAKLHRGERATKKGRAVRGR